MANRLPPPPREFNWARMLRTLSFWALLIVGTIALVQLASSRRREEAEITYSQFMEELNAGNVSSVEIAERQKVRGAFQRAVVVKRQMVERFNVLLPFEADEKWVEAPGPQQRGIEDVGAIRGGEQDDALVGFKAVHLDEQLVQGLLALVMAAAQPRATVAANRVDLVDENDARRVLLALLEQVAHARGADADEHFDEVGAGDREERHPRLAGDCAREQRLTGAGRAVEQDALGDLRADGLELGRVLEELLYLL